MGCSAPCRFICCFILPEPGKFRSSDYYCHCQGHISFRLHLISSKSRVFQSAGVSFQTSRDIYTQGKRGEGGSHEGQAGFRRRQEEKLSLMGALWGKEGLFGGVP